MHNINLLYTNIKYEPRLKSKKENSSQTSAPPRNRLLIGPELSGDSRDSEDIKSQ